jgi:acyl dehydratase
MGELYFEDFAVGQVYETAAATLDEDDIVAFGKRYANLPYHTDPDAARTTAFGGLVAPGYQTAALTFGLFVDLGLFAASGMGSPGIDKLRWLKPVRPGDTLHVTAEVIEVSPAQSEGGRDGVRFRYETINQSGDKVMTATSLHLLKRRPA